MAHFHNCLFELLLLRYQFSSFFHDDLFFFLSKDQWFARLAFIVPADSFVKLFLPYPLNFICSPRKDCMKVLIFVILDFKVLIFLNLQLKLVQKLILIWFFWDLFFLGMAFYDRLEYFIVSIDFLPWKDSRIMNFVLPYVTLFCFPNAK